MFVRRSVAGCAEQQPLPVVAIRRPLPQAKAARTCRREPESWMLAPTEPDGAAPPPGSERQADCGSHQKPRPSDQEVAVERAEGQPTC